MDLTYLSPPAPALLVYVDPQQGALFREIAQTNHTELDSTNQLRRTELILAERMHYLAGEANVMGMHGQRIRLTFDSFGRNGGYAAFPLGLIYAAFQEAVDKHSGSIVDLPPKLHVALDCISFH
ncbi:hypothetical protein EM868_09250 [Cupriavidus gilardii]|uniref:hypothetical protein n=1 Tax=Cupriavidus gilardii TaxID=82541 RepID=UPI001EE620C4|nr:hypothetical protein [Cupriavidus gilardii]MCG5259757.1 hypothetical protein [Cupriavidus gilardii]MDF9429983.1 hypothetical protein [Cupriavidus gilardii]